MQDGKRSAGPGRGALHLHVIVRSLGPVDLAQLRERAMLAGFGHSVDLAPFVPGSKRAAYYVSKYVTDACDARDEVPWAMETVDLDTGEVLVRQVPGRYRTWSMSRGYGPSMAVARAEAAVFARAAADRVVALSEAAAVEALQSLGAVLVLEGSPADGPAPPG